MFNLCSIRSFLLFTAAKLGCFHEFRKWNPLFCEVEIPNAVTENPLIPVPPGLYSKLLRLGIKKDDFLCSALVFS